MLAKSTRVKLVSTMIMLLVACDVAAAQGVPLPRPRPFSGVTGMPTPPPKPEAPQPSACRLRLTSELAIAPSLPPIEGPGECGAPDLVRLEAVVLEDLTRVTINPPATLRCTMAEAIVEFVRADVRLGAGMLSASKTVASHARRISLRNARRSSSSSITRTVSPEKSRISFKA